MSNLSVVFDHGPVVATSQSPRVMVTLGDGTFAAWTTEDEIEWFRFATLRDVDMTRGFSHIFIIASQWMDLLRADEWMWNREKKRPEST